MAGYAAGYLLLGRIVWGFAAKGYSHFSKFPFRPAEGVRYAWLTLTGRAKRFIGHNPAGSLVIYGMLATGLLTVGTGLVKFNDAYLPDYVPDFGAVHGVLAWSWLALVVTHISGVIVESLLHRENLVKSMITGFKQRHLHAGEGKTLPIRKWYRALFRAGSRVLIVFRKMRSN